MARIPQRWHLRLALAFVTLAATGWGQSALHWTSYKMADGLSKPVFNSVCVTSQGKILATSPHAPLAAELDGYAVTNFPAPPGGVGRLGESPGGQRWAITSQGLLEFKQEAWVLHPVPEIAAAMRPEPIGVGHPPPFIPLRQGTVLFMLPQGLMEFSEDSPDETKTRPLPLATEISIGSFTGMAEAGDGALWLAGTLGLARIAGPIRNLAPGSRGDVFIPPAVLRLGDFTKPEPGDNGGIVVLAAGARDREKSVVIFNGHDWISLPAGTNNFSRAWWGPDESVWAATPRSLMHWVPDETRWIQDEEISPSRIDDVAVEPGGAFWLATADGLLRGGSPLWRKPRDVPGLDAPVSRLAMTAGGALCFIAGNQLSLVQNKTRRNFPLPPEWENSPAAPALFPLKDGSLLIQGPDALKQFDPSAGSFQIVGGRDGDAPAALGLLPDGSASIFHGGTNGSLDTFDGSHFHPLPNPPELRGDEKTLTASFAMHNGDFWIGGGPEILWGHNGRWQRFATDDSSAPENPVGFAEMPDGKTWCVTEGALWSFDGHNWLLLQNKFNHVNALWQSRAGDVWVASNGGLLRYCSGAWIDYGAADGVPNGAVYDLCEGPQGRIWAATTHGLSVFHPEVDPDPPQSHVLRMAEDASRLSTGDTLNLLFEGTDKWKYTPRGNLLFSHQTDQLGWAPFREGTAFALPDLAAGHHSFAVRAMDHNGNVSAAEAFAFTVATPWFLETRLWVVLALGGAAALFFAAIAWQRHRQLVRSYALVEQAVAERTRELEVATQELLHSQKMTALGTLAAGIAHDFNNILSIIKGSAQIIEDNPHQPEKIRTRVARIKTVVQQGAEIVEAMLGFSRTPTSPAARCDINTVVAGTMKLLGDRFLHAAEVTFVPGENVPELAVSPEFIQQILINLIFNAAEAMDDEKQIALTTAVTDCLPPNIFLQPAKAEAFVLVSVRDQGSGIPPEIQSRIFEPFFTTKALSSRRGTGLGLSMVYELARKMGAGLAVHSVVGQGSEFTLIIPVPLASTEAPCPAEAATSHSA